MKNKTYAWNNADAESAIETSVNEVFTFLRRLDHLLERALQTAHRAWGTDDPCARFRGLYLSNQEVNQRLQCEPGHPIYAPGEFLDDCAGGSGLIGELQQKFGLCPFEAALVIIALAPEVDLRYERLYAYLQDDVTRKRPTVDLALNLLCSSAEEKVRRRAHFADDAPLFQQRIIHGFDDPNCVQPPLLARYLKLDEQVVRWLLREEQSQGVDGRLLPFCRLAATSESPDWVPVQGTISTTLEKLLRSDGENAGRLMLHFRGPSKAQMRRAAQDAAIAQGAHLLMADFSRRPGDSDFEEMVGLVLREAQLHGAIPFLEGIEDLSRLAAASQLAEYPGVIIVASPNTASLAVDGLQVIAVDFAVPNMTLRRSCWVNKLAERGVEMNRAALDGLAGRFRLIPEQIGRAVDEGCARARWRRAESDSGAGHGAVSDIPEVEDLYAAARAQSALDLRTVARRLEPVYTWDDLILPENSLSQLREICERVKHQEQIMGAWGFGRKLALGKGTSALFAGPSGTGKTMSTEIIAREVGLDVYKIDLAGVVSKYIGETEKNLDRIFTAAEGSNAILFFDEADALFGKRSEVRDSHDRYANLEISYLLQKIDAYEGTAILATNLRQNMDEAFLRRLAFTVLFPFPAEADRRRIWQKIWPAETPVGEDVDFNDLAKRFKLTGGNIKNIALAAAFLAASDGGVVIMDHLFHATGREFEKMGKALSAAELYGADKNEQSESTLRAMRQ